MDLPDFEPAFNTLGLFDEESCRFFLRELGERIVPFYPYFVGIEEVYSVLLERYGRAQIADVLSVLHELLEDEATAGGFGDDGDIWRSWRYSWRHRNDGLLTPFVARVGNFVLPPPTPVFIRRFKAESFAKLYAGHFVDQSQQGEFCRGIENAQPSQLSHSIDPPDHQVPRNVSEATATLRDLTSSPQNEGHPCVDLKLLSPPKSNKCNIGPRPPNLSIVGAEGEEEDRDSEQDFMEIGLPADLGEFDPTLFVSFDIMQPRSYDNESCVSLRGGDLGNCTLQQVRSEKSGSSIPLRGKSQDAEKSKFLTGAKAEAISGPKELQDYGVSEREKQAPNKSMTEFSAQPDLQTYMPMLQDSPDISKASTSNDTDQSQRIESSHEMLPPRRKSNRQARLIDGAIFTGRAGKARKMPSSPPRGHREVGDAESARSSPVRFSWTGTRQKQSLRQSWLSGVRSLFRTENHNKHDGHQRHTSSTSMINYVDRVPRMSPSVRRETSPAFNMLDARRRLINQSFGLDGICDLSPSPSRSPVDLNKPLPLFPSEKRHQRSASVQTRTPSFAHSQSPTYRPSTASTASSIYPQTPGQKDFQDLAEELLKSSIMTHPPDLSTVHEADIFRAQPSPLSFSSFINANPFRNDPIPLTPSAPAPLSFRKATNPENGFEARQVPPVPPVPKIPQSQSEPNLQPYDPKTPKRVQVSDYPVPSHLTPFSSKSHLQQPVQELPSPARGRALEKPERHEKIPRNGTEEKASEVGKTPQKRSRSPVKRFFGFGKSMSLRDIAGDPASKPVEVQSQQMKQAGGKSWANKLRHGFLTSDADGESDSILIMTQSTPERSTFPISLDSPFQARLLSELELMLVISANRYLLEESHAGRISPLSVAKLREAWTSMNRPQVIEFQYDFITQRELVMVNLKTLKLNGECAGNPIVLNATMYGWKTMAKEMSVRTFCAPDSVVRKWLHDSHKIFELLGAGVSAFFAFQELQVKTLTKINAEQKKKIERKHLRNASAGSQKTESATPEEAIRKFALSPTPGSMTKKTMRKATGAESAIEGSPTRESSLRKKDTYNNSRGGRLGMMVREFGV